MNGFDVLNAEDPRTQFGRGEYDDLLAGSLLTITGESSEISKESPPQVREKALIREKPFVRTDSDGKIVVERSKPARAEYLDLLSSSLMTIGESERHMMSDSGGGRRRSQAGDLMTCSLMSLDNLEESRRSLEESRRSIAESRRSSTRYSLHAGDLLTCSMMSLVSIADDLDETPERMAPSPQGMAPSLQGVTPSPQEILWSQPNFQQPLQAQSNTYAYAQNVNFGNADGFNIPTSLNSLNPAAFTQPQQSTQESSQPSPPNTDKQPASGRKKIDRTMKEPEDKIYVTENEITAFDVIKGQGAIANKNPGNRRYWDKMMSVRDVYTQANDDNQRKHEIATQVLDFILEGGSGIKGRFLKLDKSKQYYVVTDTKWLLDGIKYSLRSGHVPRHMR